MSEETCKTPEEAIKKWLDSHPGGYTTHFSGQNCFDHGECSGWTYGERRCDCGNRRVDLEVNQYKDESWVAYPEAY